jgi:DHA2 family multidrug resistance protein
MSQLNLKISPWHVVWPRVVMVAGSGLVFALLNVAAYLYTPRALRGAAVGLLALLRNEGGSVGTSMGQTITERRKIFHALRLNEHLDPLNPAANSYIDQAPSGFLQQTGDTAAAEQMAWQSLESLREQQASALAYFDAFLIFAVHLEKCSPGFGVPDACSIRLRWSLLIRISGCRKPLRACSRRSRTTSRRTFEGI